MTVLCLVELDSGEIIDPSVRALTFARTLAQSQQAGSAAPGMPTAAGLAGAPGSAGGAGLAGAGGAVGSPGAQLSAAGSAGEPSAAGSQPGDLAVAVIGAAGPVPGQVLAAAGVFDVFVVEPDQLTSYAPLAWSRALAELTAVAGADVVVAAGTDRGNEVMAHLGALTGEPMVANCVSAGFRGQSTERSAGSVSASAGPARGRNGQWLGGPPPGQARAVTLQIVRQRWAGSLLEDAVLDASPALLTVAYDAVVPVPAAGPAAAQIHHHRPAFTEDDLRVRVVESAEPSVGVSLATARVVVGGGRGVGGADGFGALEELAGLLGAAVGVSRVVTSQGWRPHTQQVGQTGTRIAPELYLACGISGAIQHMAGCSAPSTLS